MYAKTKQSLVAAFFFVLTIAGYGWYWLKSPYEFSMQRQMATGFVQLIAQGEFEKAYEMTIRTEFTGKNLEEFKSYAQKEIRGANYTIEDTFPKQTNGNRLRRFLSGAEVEMSVVHVEFVGHSLLKVAFQHTGDNQWKIHKFYSHAG